MKTCQYLTVLYPVQDKNGSNDVFYSICCILHYDVNLTDLSRSQES